MALRQQSSPQGQVSVSPQSTQHTCLPATHVQPVLTINSKYVLPNMPKLNREFGHGRVRHGHERVLPKFLHDTGMDEYCQVLVRINGTRGCKYCISSADAAARWRSRYGMRGCVCDVDFALF